MTAAAIASIFAVGLDVAPAKAASMSFHEYNMCGNKCVFKDGTYGAYAAANRVVSEVNEGTQPFAIVLNEVCAFQANHIQSQLPNYRMTTRYIFTVPDTACGQFGNVIFTLGNIAAPPNLYTGYFTTAAGSA